MMVGVQRHPNPREVQIFRTLAGRNAINFHPPSYAAEVVLASEDADPLRHRFKGLLTRSDALPYGGAAAALMPPRVDPGVTSQPCAKRALLIVGSPKTNSPSTSNALGSYLLERLHSLGWETESLTLRASLNREEGRDALLSSFDQAGLILLVFPLYVDSLPFLVTKALALMAEHRRSLPEPRPQRLMAIVNSGFPETNQNAVALAICREFAAQTGMAWAGRLALGAGGAIGSEPLLATKRSGPPVRHVIHALDLTAAALAEGRPTPPEAARLMTKCPIPLIPFGLWRWMYVRIGGRGFERVAAKNGVSKDKLLDQPYAALS